MKPQTCFRFFIRSVLQSLLALAWLGFAEVHAALILEDENPNSGLVFTLPRGNVQLMFSATPFGGSSKRSLVLRNTGTVAVSTPSLSSAAGDFSAQFVTVPVGGLPATSVPARGSVYLQLTFAPASGALGLRTASLSMGAWTLNLSAHTGPVGGIAAAVTSRLHNSYFVIGYPHSLILKSDGSLWATGSNNVGQLGVGDFTDRRLPTLVLSGGVSAVAAGDGHSLILKNDGSLWAMGSNANGKLGLGLATSVNRSIPTQVLGGGVAAMAAGKDHNLIVKSDGSLWAMGANGAGQLGLGDSADRNSPTQVWSSSASSVSAGWSQSMIIKQNGQLWAAGAEVEGVLGLGVSEQFYLLPTQVLASSSFIKTAIGESYSLMIRSDGSLLGTGANYTKLLTADSNLFYLTPTQVRSSNGTIAVAAGSNHVFQLKADGSLFASGYNNKGQLGLGDTTNREGYVSVFSGGVAAVDAGTEHSLILKTNGSLWSCGGNAYGQLGLGDALQRSSPTLLPMVWEAGALPQTSGNYQLDLKSGVMGGLLPWSFTISSGSLPTGMSLSSDGVLSGQPLAWGNFAFTVRVSDSSSPALSVSKSFVLRGSPFAKPAGALQAKPGASLSLAIGSANLPAGSSFALAEGSSLPPGLSLDAATGIISGQPSVPGVYSFTVIFTGSSGTESRDFEFNIFSITTSSLPAGRLELPYSLPLRMEGGSGNFVWSWSAAAGSSLPPGLSLSSAGLISGTPSQPGLFRCLVRIDDGNNPGLSDSRELVLQVNSALLKANGLDSALVLPASGSRLMLAATPMGLATGGSTRDLPLRNNLIGSAPLQVFTLDFSGADAQDFSASIHDAQGAVLSTLAAGQVAVLRLRFRPRTASHGLRQARLQISSKDAAGTADGRLELDLDLSAHTAAEGCIVSTAAGLNHSLILKSDGSLWVAGSNVGGQLGLGDTESRSRPARLMDSGVCSIVAGQNFSLMLLQDGSLWGFGSNPVGQLGRLSSDLVLRPERSLDSGVYAMVVGLGTTLILKSDGSLFAMGSNEYGQFGIGPSAPISSADPQLLLDSGVKSVSAGSLFTLLHQTNGSLWSAGSNQDGALGLGISDVNTKVKTFTQLPSEALTSGVAAIATGGSHALVLENDGSLWGAGRNYWWQLGLSSRTRHPQLTRILGPGSGVVAIRAAESTSFCLKGDGSLWCMGFNSGGQLGLGDLEHRSSLTQVLASGVRSVSPGGSHSLLVKTDGSLWVTGINDYGQLGLGDTSNRNSFTLLPPYLDGLALPAARANYLLDLKTRSLGGLPPYRYAITSGSLPEGLALSSNGVISGTPSAAAQPSRFRVSLTDSSTPAQIYESPELSLSPLAVATASPLPKAQIGTEYGPLQLRVNADDPLESLTWTWSAQADSSLPQGMSFSRSGVLSGRPTVAGQYRFIVQVSDAASPANTASKEMVLDVPVFVQPSNLGVLTLGQSLSLNLAIDNLPAGSVLGLAANSTLPAGLVLTSAGLLSGAVTQAGIHRFTLVFSFGAITDTRGFELRVFGIQPEALAPGLLGQPYQASLSAPVGKGALSWSWSAAAGSSLPPGLSLDAASGSIGGQPTAVGLYRFVVQVSDSSTPALTTSRSLALAVFDLQTQALPKGFYELPYNASLAASGGLGPLSWSWSAAAGSSLPPGLSLDPATGAITGKPTEAGDFRIIVQVSDGSSPPFTMARALDLTIFGIVRPALSVGSLDSPYEATLTAAGAEGALTWSWSAAEGSSLPPGLNLDAASGIIAGTPTLGGTYQVVVQLSDSSSPPQTTTRAFTLAVFGINTKSLLKGKVETPYNASLAAGGGVGPLTWSWTAAAGSRLPPGLSLDAATGVISGTPTAAGVFDLIFQVSDSRSPALTWTRPLSLTIFGVANDALSSATLDLPYEASLTAAGAEGALTWSWSAAEGSSLPPGLSLDPATGIIAGTPTLGGTYRVVVQLSDSSSPPQSTTRAFTLAVFGINTKSLHKGNVETPYNASLAAGGGLGPLSWSWSAAAGSRLPPGLSLDAATGVMSGTPTAAGVFRLIAQVSDSRSPALTWTRPLSLTIFGVANDALSSATLDLPYEASLTAVGTEGALTWSWSAAEGSSLPPGLSLDPATGIIAGTPTLGGTYQVVVQLSDSSSPPQTTTRAFTLVVFGIKTAALPQGAFKQAYNATLTAEGGEGALTWSWSAAAGSSLPPGLNLDSATGAISGTPTTAGVFRLIAQVSDSRSPALTRTRPLSLTIFGIANDALSSATLDLPYEASLTAVGTEGALTWSWSADVDSSLPPGLNLDAATGIIAGTPTLGGTYRVVVQLSDSSSPPQTTTRAFTLAVFGINTKSLLKGKVETPYNASLAAGGGVGPLTWSWTAAAGSRLPPGLSLDAATGVISGTPTAAGVFDLIFQVSDSRSPALTRTRPLSLTIFGIANDALSSATLDLPYEASLTAVGTEGALTWSWSAAEGSSLPPGLSLDPATGIIAGTPTLGGTYQVVVQLSDSSSPPQTTTRAFTLAVFGIKTAALPQGAFKQAYNATLTAEGGEGALTWSWSAGDGSSLPPGLNLDSATGAISGTPTAAGVFRLIAQVRDSRSPALTRTRPLSLTIFGIANDALSSATLDLPYEASLTAAGAEGALTWSWSAAEGSSLPPGLSLDPATGIIAGTPTLGGTYQVVVQLSDSSSPPQTTTRAFTLAVFGINTKSLLKGKVETPYNASLAAGGGVGPLTWSWTAAAGSRLPPGLSLDAATGVISGTPTAAGVFDLIFQVSDSRSPALTRTRPLSLTIFGIANDALSSATLDLPYEASLTAVGTEGALTWSWSADVDSSLPPGLNLDAATGIIAGTPTLGGTYRVVVQLSDSSSPPQTTTRAFTLAVFGIKTAALPPGSLESAYTVALEVLAAQGATSWTWSAAAESSLPAGLSLSADGRITGTPTEAGGFHIILQASNGSSPRLTHRRQLHLQINGALLRTGNSAQALALPHSGGQLMLAASPMGMAVGGSVRDLPLRNNLVGSADLRGLSWNFSGADAQDFSVSLRDAQGAAQRSLAAGQEGLLRLIFQPRNGAVGLRQASLQISSVDEAGLADGRLEMSMDLSAYTGPVGGVAAVESCAAHSLILKSDGSLWAMGNNALGQLGLGNKINQDRPRLVMGAGVAAISKAWDVSLILKEDGSLWGVGDNGQGGFGFGDLNDRTMPSVLLSGGVFSAAAGGGHLLVLKSDGSLWGCGANTQGQLGLGDSDNRIGFEQVISRGVRAVAAGERHSLVVKVDGSLWACGDNAHGQLGLGHSNDCHSFQQVVASDVRHVAAGSAYSMALKTDGSLWVMGQNTKGQLGLADMQNRNRPTLAFDSGISALAAGDLHGFLLRSDGSPWSTGLNQDGQLGLSDQEDRMTYTSLALAEVSDLSAGGAHSLLLKNDGSLWGAGRNTAGQLGLGNLINRSSFTLLPLVWESTVITAHRQRIHTDLKATILGGQLPWSFRVTAGSLPHGVSVSSDGILSGSVAQFNAASFTVQVSDSSSPGSSQRMEFTLEGSAFALPNDLSPLVLGQSLSLKLASANLPADGRYEVASDSSLPSGLELSSTGELSGLPTQPGTHRFTINFIADGITQSREFVLPVFGISTQALPAALLDDPYAVSLNASGATGAVSWTWSAAEGSRLPPGLNLDAVTGAITGSPTTPGVFNLMVQASDGSSPMLIATRSLTLSVFGIETKSLPRGLVEIAYNASLAAAGGEGALLWSWSAEAGCSLPAGLSLDPASGLITGTPTAVGIFQLTVQVSDSSSPPLTRTRSLSLAVFGMATDALSAGFIGFPYNANLAAVGGQGALTWTWSAAAGSSLPAGLTLDPTTGSITGTPRLAGTYRVAVQVSDSSLPALRTERIYRLQLNPSLQVEADGQVLPEASELFFRATAPGRQSQRDLSLRNLSDQALRISASNPADFSLLGFGPEPVVLEAGSVKEVSLMFAPRRGSNIWRRGRLLLQGNGLDAFSLNLSGQCLNHAQESQSISLTNPGPLLVGQAASQVLASSSSGLPVTLSLSAVSPAGCVSLIDGNGNPVNISSNANSVATLRVNARGSFTLTATQVGDQRFAPAIPVVLKLSVTEPASGKLVLTNLNHVYDGNPKAALALGLPAGSSAEIKYTINKVVGSAAPTQAGSYPVTATCNASIGGKTVTLSASATLVIRPAPLYLRALNQQRRILRPNNTLDYRISNSPDGPEIEKAMIPWKLLTPASNGRPAVYDEPRLSTTASISSPAGNYPISFASKGSSANYSIVAVPGTLSVEGFGSRHEALLSDAAANPIGLLSLSSAAVKTTPAAVKGGSPSYSLPFSASLRSTHNPRPSPIAFAGSFTVDEAGNQLDQSVNSSDKASGLELRNLSLDRMGNLSGDFYKGQEKLSSFSGRRLLEASEINQPYAGQHSWIIEPGFNADLSLPSLNEAPQGSGFASALIASNGNLTLVGKLADGSNLSATLPADISANPGYRLFVQPYNRADSLISGNFNLLPHPSLSQRRYLPAANLKWFKSEAATDANYPSGFDLRCNALIDPWLAPQTKAPVITLLNRWGNAGNTANYRFAYSNPAGGADQLLSIALSDKNLFTTALNPSLNWRMTLTPTTGIISGSFLAPDKKTISFSGILRQPANGNDDLLGAGMFSIPAVSKAAKPTAGAFEIQR